MTTHHTIEAHFEVSGTASAGGAHPLTDMIIDRMANAALGGCLGANPHADTLARARALEVYVMVRAMMQGIAEIKL